MRSWIVASGCQNAPWTAVRTAANAAAGRPPMRARGAAAGGVASMRTLTTFTGARDAVAGQHGYIRAAARMQQTCGIGRNGSARKTATSDSETARFTTPSS